MLQGVWVLMRVFGFSEQFQLPPALGHSLDATALLAPTISGIQKVIIKLTNKKLDNENHGSLSFYQHQSTFEEELINVIPAFLVLSTSGALRLLLFTAMFLWAFVQTIELLDQTKWLEKPGVKQNLIQMAIVSKVSIIEYKNRLEVVAMFLGIVSVITGNAGPLFPLFFYQYLRVKYASNFFCKSAFSWFYYEVLLPYVPTATWNIEVVKVFLKFLAHQVGEEELDPE